MRVRRSTGKFSTEKFINKTSLFNHRDELIKVFTEPIRLYNLLLIRKKYLAWIFECLKFKSDNQFKEDMMVVVDLKAIENLLAEDSTFAQLQKLKQLREKLIQEKLSTNSYSRTEIAQLNKLKRMIEKLQAIENKAQGYLPDLNKTFAIHVDIPPKILQEAKNRLQSVQKLTNREQEKSESIGSFSLADAIKEFKQQKEDTQLLEWFEKAKKIINANNPCDLALYMLKQIGTPITSRKEYEIPVGRKIKTDISKVKDFLNDVEDLTFYVRRDGFLPIFNKKGELLWVIDLNAVKAELAIKFRWNDCQYVVISTTNEEVCVARYCESKSNKVNVILACNKIEGRVSKKFADNVMLDLLDIAVYYKKYANYDRIVKAIEKENEKLEHAEKIEIAIPDESNAKQTASHTKIHYQPYPEKVYKTFGDVYFDLLVDYFAGLIDVEHPETSKSFQKLHKMLEIYSSEEFLIPYLAEYQTRFDVSPEEIIRIFRKPYFRVIDFQELTLFSFRSKILVGFRLNHTIKYPTQYMDELWSKVIKRLIDSGTLQRVERMIADRIASTQYSRRAMWFYLEKTVAKSPQSVVTQLLDNVLNLILPLSYKTKNITGFVVEYVRNQIVYLMNQIYNSNKVFTPPSESIPYNHDRVFELLINREIRKMLAPVIDYYGEEFIDLFNEQEYQTVHRLVTAVVQPIVWAIFDKQFNLAQYVGAKQKYLNLYISYLLERDAKLKHLAQLLRSIAYESPYPQRVSTRTLQKDIDRYYAKFSPERQSLLKKTNFVKELLLDLGKHVFQDLVTNLPVKVNMRAVVQELIKLLGYVNQLQKYRVVEIIQNNYYLHNPETEGKKIDMKIASLFKNLD